MSLTLSEQEINTIKTIFHQFDRNNNGYIERKELQLLSNALNNPLSPAELSDFFRAIDKDNSSQIAWDEFIKYWSLK
jgi:Ca2+-binding EF-hand superfamily protein